MSWPHPPYPEGVVSRPRRRIRAAFTDPRPEAPIRTTKQVASMLGISASLVNRYELRALEKMRKEMEEWE